MFDVSTQYDIDEKLPIIEENILIADQNKRNLGGYQSVPNSNEAVVLVEILKEQRDEGHSSEAQPVVKLTESFIDEGGNRLSGVSRFNDVDCGEPATAQHLRINFGMTEEDNVEEEKKCRSFWKFIGSHPHLEKIKVYPIPIQQSSSESPQKNDSFEPIDTAMEWIQNDDLINAATKSKFTTRYCHVDGGDYCDRGTKTKYKDAPKMKIDRYKGIKEASKSGITARTSSGDELKNLCKSMDDWDVAHTLSKDRPRPRNVKDITL